MPDQEPDSYADDGYASQGEPQEDFREDLPEGAADDAIGRQEPSWQEPSASEQSPVDAFPSAAGQIASPENLARSKANWWLPDGYHVFLADWKEDDWVRFLGFDDFRDVQDFALRGMDVLGRSSETHNLSRLQQVQLAMSVPYVRTNVFAREVPGRAKDWIQRCFEMYTSEFNVARAKPGETLKLPEELQGALAWQVSPVMRKLRELSEQAAGILRHALRSLKDADKLEELQQSVLGLGLLALTDLFCAPELLLHVLQSSDVLARSFPRMRELSAHIQAYRRNMPVSLQVMLGTSAVLAEEFAGDLREFSETGSDPAMCYDRLRDVQALVNVAVDLTQFALPDLIARTLQEHVEQPARQLLREGVSESVRQAASRLFAGSHAILEAVRDGKRVGNLLEQPWKLWADQVLSAMREALKAQDELEKLVLDKAKDPVKNLKALQELAMRVDAFEQSSPCQALQDLLANEPVALQGARHLNKVSQSAPGNPQQGPSEQASEVAIGASDRSGLPPALAVEPNESAEPVPSTGPLAKVEADQPLAPAEPRAPRDAPSPAVAAQEAPQTVFPAAAAQDRRPGAQPSTAKPIPRREELAQSDHSGQAPARKEEARGASEDAQAPRGRHPRPNKPRSQHPPGHEDAGGL